MLAGGGGGGIIVTPLRAVGITHYVTSRMVYNKAAT